MAFRPFDIEKKDAFLAPTGDGPVGYSNLAILSNFLVPVKPLGQQLVSGDDSIGKLGVPNPRYTGRGTNVAHTPGFTLHDDPYWDTHYKWFQGQTQGYDYHVLLTQMTQNRTPIALPNVLPHQL